MAPGGAFTIADILLATVLRQVRATDLASGLVGAVIKDPTQDQVAWAEYLETVVKERDGWKDLYRAAREVE